MLSSFNGIFLLKENSQILYETADEASGESEIGSLLLVPIYHIGHLGVYSSKNPNISPKSKIQNS